MTNDTHPRDTTEDPGADRASGAVRSDAAGQTTVPPGSGDVDREAVDKGAEKLEQAGGGH